MVLNSDIILYHPIWERADTELCGKEGISLFNRLIDVYILACAIGIKEDKTLKAPDDSNIVKTIGRNTYMSLTNTNLHDLLHFMLQNAIINSKELSYDIDERLKLAFDPDYSVNKFSPANFLTGFANYGMDQIFKKIDSNSSIVAIDELYNYFSTLEESRYDDILKNITLDNIQ